MQGATTRGQGLVRIGGVKVWHPSARGYAEQLGWLGGDGGGAAFCCREPWLPLVLLGYVAAICCCVVVLSRCITLLL